MHTSYMHFWPDRTDKRYKKASQTDSTVILRADADRHPVAIDSTSERIARLPGIS